MNVTHVIQMEPNFSLVLDLYFLYHHLYLNLNFQNHYP